MTGRIDRTGGGMALSRAPAADREALSAQRLSQSPAPAGMAAPAGAAPGYVPGVHSGYWVVDPGVHKQSQDWVYVGPVPRRAAPPRRPWWPVTLAAALAGLACLLAAAGALLARVAGLSPATLIRNPLFDGLLAAALFFAGVALWRLARRGARPSRAAPPPERPGSGAAAVDPNMTFTEAGERAAVERAAEEATETADGVAAATGVPEDDLLLSDDEAGRRQAWEGEIPIDPPTTWPDRPTVVAIGDGVSSALRSAEIARLATRTAWHRTFYHLHALGSGAPPDTAKPWLAIPPGWPPPGPERDELLRRALCRAFADANTAAIMAGKEHRRQNPSETRPTATTLSLLGLDGMRYHLVHIGDCSVYHVHGEAGEVEPRQVEHNRAAAYAQLEPAHYAARYDEARRRGMQNVLTRWLGMTTDWTGLDAQVLQPPGELVPGDALVLCSDGLDKHVTQDAIGRAVVALDAEAATHHLIAWANDRGGSDHVAVAVLQTRRRRDPVRTGARWALWREEFATAWYRYRNSTLGIALAGAAVAVLVAGAVFLTTRAGLLAPPAPVPAATAVAPASPAPPVAGGQAAGTTGTTGQAIPTPIPTVSAPATATGGP